MNEVIRKLLALIPTAQFVITTLDNKINVDDGFSTLVELSGFLIVWNSTNTSPCPTQVEIDAVN